MLHGVRGAGYKNWPLFANPSLPLFFPTINISISHQEHRLLCTGISIIQFLQTQSSTISPLSIDRCPLDNGSGSIFPSLKVVSYLNKLNLAASSSQNRTGVWPNGAPPKSRKAKNRAWNKILPKSNTPNCRSYADFTRFMLGYTTEHPEYPDPPSMIDIVTLPPLTKDAILHESSVFTTYNSSAHSDPTDWAPFKALLQADLLRHGVHQYTFEWHAHDGEDSPWNLVMIFFTVKHWKFAKGAYAFDNGYGLDMRWDQDIIQVGIMKRWLCGRIEEIKNGFNQDAKVKQRHRTRKRREVNYHTILIIVSG